MKKIAYASATLLIFIFLNACKGPVGDTGPIGPAGPQGATGAKGDPGTSGSAIISTGWILAKKADLVKFYNATEFYTSIGLSGGNIDKMSQKTLDEGIVLVYNRLSTNKTVVALVPWDTYFQGSHVTYSFAVEPKFVTCFVSFSKATDVNAFFTADEEYRVIIIQGPNGGRLKNIDYKNYDEVIKAYNISTE